MEVPLHVEERARWALIHCSLYGVCVVSRCAAVEIPMLAPCYVTILRSLYLGRRAYVSHYSVSSLIKSPGILELSNTILLYILACRVVSPPSYIQ